MKNNIFLPGTNKQINHLLNTIDLTNKKILVVGTNTKDIVNKIPDSSNIEVIVGDYENLVELMNDFSGKTNVKVRLMEYSATDFSNETFDIIYAQASISNFDRNKIVKEFKRISKPEAIFCIGEITRKSDEVPPFLKNILDNNSLNPLLQDKIEEYYTERKFEIIEIIDLSETLNDFYTTCIEFAKTKLEDSESKDIKELQTRLVHEAKAYIKYGGDKYMGMKALIMKVKK